MNFISYKDKELINLDKVYSIIKDKNRIIFYYDAFKVSDINNIHGNGIFWEFDSNDERDAVFENIRFGYSNNFQHK